MILDFLQGDTASEWNLLYTEDGEAAVFFDSMLGVEVSTENQVAQEPVEQGSFASYNKSASPRQVKVTLARSGDGYDHDEIICALDELCSGTDLLTLITPAQEYEGYNLESYNYRRSETNGVQLLVVELSLVEIRQVESQATTTVDVKPAQAKNKSDASKANTGKTQAKTPPEAKAEQATENKSMAYEAVDGLKGVFKR